ncbi:spermidine/putrescine ABC transporter periplasmic spermidine/putrescine-binding protein PotD [Desulfovibrio sp. X2]|uniref:extracellular solute-binding protein n=1 Tax=Desulfovibrio sp. X2 TaxID=941449 RepID=UPI000358A87F|nr:extracellular solute-binding protein [Desulfovibrio sp. X2]EPR39988.1 spermidine/putrescine ABC transporter periplasmic spermidine/putrescine-binding protein PotD [Desulfovibrio sp. X2]
MFRILVLVFCLVALPAHAAGQPVVLLPAALAGSLASLGLPGSPQAVVWHDANEALRLLQAGPQGSPPALAVLPARAADEAVRQGLLAPLPPEEAAASPDSLRLPSDPDANLARPWLWDATGIGYDALAASPPASLKELWMPGHAGSVALPDDAERVMEMTLLLLGYPADDADPGHIDQARQFLSGLVPRALVGASPAFAPLADGSAGIGIFNATDVARARRDAVLPRADFAAPEDGFLLRPLYVVLPKTASADAQALAQALLTPEAEVRAAAASLMAPADPAAVSLLPPELRALPPASLSPETLRLGRLALPTPDALAAYRAAWKALRALPGAKSSAVSPTLP